MESVQRRASLSGLEIRVLSRELAGLSGGYVSSIHSLGESQVLRIKKSGDGDSSVVLSPKFGAWITQRPAQTVTNEFTTSLRQKLLRLRLENVSQYDLDRVISLDFSGNEGEVKAVLELMPPGNIILTDSGGKILLALRESRGSQRTILKRSTYAPPPQTRGSPEHADEESLARSLANERTVGKALGRSLALPRRYVDEILARAGLAQDDPTNIPQEKIRQISRVVSDLLASLDSPTPCIVRSGDATEVMAVRPLSAEVVQTAPTMSIIADQLFSPLLLGEAGEAGREKDQRLKEYEVTLQRLERRASDLAQRAHSLREAAAALRTAASADEVEAIMASSAIDSKLRVASRAETSTAAISSLLFDQAKEAESETIKIQEVVRKLQRRLEKTQKVAPKATVRVVTRPNKEWYEKFRWFFTTEGRLAVGGRDAQSNELLVKRHLEQGDVVYHADLFGSPFFILKDGENQTPDEVRQLAQATVAFSSAWKTGLAAADAYWVAPEQVSTTAPSGEYLARGSFIIRGKKSFATRNPVEVAVGLDSKGRVMAGPEEALMRLSSVHVTLIPSREKTSDTAKKVLFELKKLYGDEPVNSDLDDVVRILPAGGGKIVRRRVNQQRPGSQSNPTEGEPT